MAGPIALEKKYFLKIASVEDSLEDIKDIESIEKVNKEGKLIPIFNEWYLILLSNRFYGHKYREQELKEMIDEKGNIIKNNEKYQKMYNVIKYAFITEIEDLHNNLETLCFYGGLDEAVGVTVFANLKKKADKDGRKLELIYSRYATHSNLISPAYYKLPSNFIRCHKSFIANIDNIVRVEGSENMIYFDGSNCDIGPKYKSYFLEVFNNHGNFN